jgi:hypothetical protein
VLARHKQRQPELVVLVSRAVQAEAFLEPAEVATVEKLMNQPPDFSHVHQ